MWGLSSTQPSAVSYQLASYLPAALVTVDSETTVCKALRKTSNWSLYHLRLFWKHTWISEPVRQRNKRTRPEFDAPVISKSTGLNPKCKNVTQWYWGPIQMCSLWSVICICRTGLTNDLLELSKHLELVKEEVCREIIWTPRFIWSVWVTIKQIFMQFIHKNTSKHLQESTKIPVYFLL